MATAGCTVNTQAEIKGNSGGHSSIPIDTKLTAYLLFLIVIPQREISARDWSKSRHVTLTNMHCRRALWPADC